jgi:hypothetical protein
MNWLILLISALATYRLSLMWSSEEGPLAIFARMRRKVPPKTNPGRGIRCFMCWSVWIAAAVTLYLLWLGTITKEISPPLSWHVLLGDSLPSSQFQRLADQALLDARRLIFCPIAFRPKRVGEIH